MGAVHDGYDVQAVLAASGSPFDVSEGSPRRRMANEGGVPTAANTQMAELARDRGRSEGGLRLGIESATPCRRWASAFVRTLPASEK